MCGIAGYFARDRRPVDTDVLVAMTRTLVHRGPDEEGYFVNRSAPAGPDVPLRGLAGDDGKGHVGLGHRRLSIIDLATGQQPLSNEDGRVWISFNGEIYNYAGLKDELEALGHTFRTNSDTETLVHAWEEWGESMATRLRGMFALAIWDERKQVLYLARDRLGMKPLYYAHSDGRFLFASEIKAILAAPGVSREIDPTALSDYLTLLYIPAPRSIFRAVAKLPAAHYAVVTADDVRITQYWDLKFTPETSDAPGTLHERIVEKLRDAVSVRMMSEVPLGAFLSGGVDSSAVVGLMAGLAGGPVKTSSISFSVAEFDEVEYARLIAKKFQTDHSEYSVDPDALSILEKLSWHYDEPFADSSAVPTYYVSKTARRTVTVALSGDGGDENFAGYRRYGADAAEQRLRSLVPRPLRGMVFGGLRALLAPFGKGQAKLRNLARDPFEAYYQNIAAFDETAKHGILSHDVLQACSGHCTVDYLRDLYDRCDSSDHLSKLLYLDIKSYLCEDILTKVDRASMAVSLEVRCPVIDHEFMELAAKIPAALKLKGGEKKWIFKKALEGLLPDEILYRPKMGFGVPLPQWLRGELK
ncbi:MAG: asparagine synthase (glutamine-hydrolyzing), partial [Planctomycetota bacterium]|nr:asparagine synthase (glutamine-hydrolyzing) [Planctomycetota bacterium]